MRSDSGIRRLLAPLIPAYRLAVFARDLSLRQGWEPVRRLRFPVISIGNLSTGGAGKTPFSIALAQAIAHRGFAADVLSRGYGRRSETTARVDPHGAPEEFGDEPLLIARAAAVPVFVAPQRYDAGQMAENDAAAPDVLRLHILDDGFQHRQLHRDIDILMLNRDDWRDRLLPAGNLREPRSALRRANVIAIPDTEPELERELHAWGWRGPVWRLRRLMEIPEVQGPVVAFCGIARPDQFFDGLESGGVHLSARIALRDHHRYTFQDFDRLRSTALTTGASTLITTAKDQVRLEHLTAPSGLDLPILTAGLRIEIQDEKASLDWLIRRLADTAIRPSL